MISLIFYNFLIFIFSPILFVFLVYFLLKTRKEWSDRWGFYNIDSNTRTFWLHGASVGEINSLKNFYKDITFNYPQYTILITSYTKTGYKRALEIYKNNKTKIYYFPFDFLISTYISLLRTKPKAIFLTETEIWPNFLFWARVFKIPVFLLGARLSDNSFPKYKAFRRFLKKTLSTYSLVFAQDRLNKKRWGKLGILKDKIIVSGSLKANHNAVEKPRLEIENNVFLWIAGPLKEGEFEPIINIYLNLKKQHKNLALMVAPRYLESIEKLKKVIVEKNEKYLLSTEIKKIDNGITILDTMGELSSFYIYAKICFIGGSLVNTGGHNPLEAAFSGVPVIMGPYYENVRDIIIKLKSIYIIKSDKELENTVKLLIENKVIRDKKAEEILEAAKKLKQSTKSIISIIKNRGYSFK